MTSAALLALLLAAPAPAQAGAPPRAAIPVPPPGPIAIERPETRTRGRLAVTSPAFPDGAPIPPRYSRNGGNLSPPLAWLGAPARTQAFAVIVDDPDGRIKPVTHWLAWDLTASALPEAVPNGPTIAQPPIRRRLVPPAAVQGTTTMRTLGYAGPRPPAGDPPHHYHFQVFALDAPLGLQPGASRDALLAAMRGHVLARGETVGLFAAPPAP